MPNVRDSSGTIGTTWWPMVLSRISVDRIRTNAIVVEISRSPVPSSCALNASSAGISSGGAVGVRDALGELRVPAEELLAHEGAVTRLVGLVVAVDGLLHAAHEEPVVVGLQQRVPAPAPDDLDDVPARAAELGLELLDDLAVAAHRAVEALQVAVDDEDQVVQALPRGQADRAHRLRLVHLAVPHERPHLAAGRVRR